MDLGERIKERRLNQGLTLLQIANLLGLSEATIQRYEAGVIVNPKRSTINKLAKILNTSPSYLLGFLDDEKSMNEEIKKIKTVHIPFYTSDYNDEDLQNSVKVGEHGFSSNLEPSVISTHEDTIADYCIRAKDDSMSNSRIYNGDLVFIKEQNMVEDGELAIIKISGEILIRRIFKIGERFQIRADNPSFKTIEIKNSLEELKIIGKAVAFQSTLL